MSKVWVKTQGQYDTYIFKDGVFGDIEAVNQDKMQYCEEAKKYIKQRIDEITKGRNRYYSKKTDLLIELEEKEENSYVNQNNPSLKTQITELKKQIENYNKSIQELEEKLTDYLKALSNPFDVIDIYLREEAYIYYEEYTLRFSHNNKE